MKKLSCAVALALVAVGVIATGSQAAPRASSAEPLTVPGRWIVIAPSKAAYNTMMAGATAAEGSGSFRIATALPQVNAVAVNGTERVVQAFAKKGKAKITKDRILQLQTPQFRREMGLRDLKDVELTDLANRLATRSATAPFRKAQSFNVFQAGPLDIDAGFDADPASDLTGLMWNLDRINAPDAWGYNGGDDDILVAVADTGLDYSHTELDDQIVDVLDFTTNERIGVGGPSICEFLYGFDDADIAAFYAIPQNLDFNGHGTWIGGNIAAEVNDNALNGIAPGVSLVSLKISQWCGAAFDSEILAAFLWASDQGVDVVSLSFGGYLDRSVGWQNAIYDVYVEAVKYARASGTTIVAAAGNDHTQIGKGGLVTSHGILDVPPGGTDYFGLYETPGGIDGVVMVSATANVDAAPSATCPSAESTDGDYPWCKPTSDPHQSWGVGLEDQLTYYSNYGPRIDVAAPGGARKFNLPRIDRGGTPGWPFTGMDSYVSDVNPGTGDSEDEGFNAYQEFSTMSNWTFDIPCFIFDGSDTDTPPYYYGVPTQTGFDTDHCYSTIQGTSMATPHVSAVVGLIISAWPDLRWDVDKIVKKLKQSTYMPNNTTRPVTKKDKTGGDLTGGSCPGGYCHLGGKAIPNKEAYGAGIVDAWLAVENGTTTP